MRVIVAGTFDLLHIGHQQLLKEAFDIAGSSGTVLIGLTTDAFASRKSHPVSSYDIRKQNLVSWIAESGFGASYHIEPLSDPFGPALTVDFDVLVVSYETYSAGEVINEKRRSAGLKTVELHRVPCIFAEDGKAVSTTRIYDGEITRYGSNRV